MHSSSVSSQTFSQPLNSAPAIIWGVAGFVSIFVLAYTGSLVLAISPLVLVFVLIMSWVPGHIPVLAFCMGYKWLYIVSGALFYGVFGVYPGLQMVPEIEKLVFFGLLGHVMMVMGLYLVTRDLATGAFEQTFRTPYQYGKLVALVFVMFTIAFIFQRGWLAVPFGIREVVQSLVVLRYLFLFLLLLHVAVYRRHKVAGALITLLVIVPELLTGMASFQTILFFFGILVFGMYKRGAVSHRDVTTNRWIITLTTIAVVVTLWIALIWSHSLKHNWRQALQSGQVQGDTIEQVQVFGSFFSDSVEHFELESAIENLVSRVSSGSAYFGYVLDRVPRIIPHERGLFLERTIKHILMPRFLFPEKTNLGSDSWIVRKYAGVWVAGEEQSTSVGLGYTGEFYIDFGVTGIIVGCLLYGLYAGFWYRILWRYSPSAPIAMSVLVALFIGEFVSYESHLPKLIGSLTQKSILALLFMLTVGKWMHKWLLINPKAVER